MPLYVYHRYNTKADFALQARVIVAVAFVPVASVDAALEVLTDGQERISEDLQPVLDWFEDNYSGWLNRNGTRHHPIFPTWMWNVLSAR